VSLKQPRRRRPNKRRTPFASVLAEQNRVADQAEAERQRLIDYLKVPRGPKPKVAPQIAGMISERPSNKLSKSETSTLAEVQSMFPDIEREFVQTVTELMQDRDVGFLEAAVHFSEKRGIDIETLVPVIKNSVVLMSKLTADAENLHFIARSVHLPI
jgi:hypothetical protein